MTRSAAFVFALSIFATAGCGSSSTAPTPAPACVQVGSACVGAPEAALCGDEVCTADVTCTSVIRVTVPAELNAAVAKATAGSCVALGAGEFGPVTLPGGVSLLGKGAGQTNVGGVTINGGASATVRGMTIKGSGLSVTEAKAFRVDRVKIVSSTGVGLWAVDTELDVKLSTISDNAGPGLFTQCKTQCDAKPKTTVSGLLARGNTTAGVLGRGVALTIKGGEISGTKPKNFQFGRGIDVSDNTDLDASSLVVSDNWDVGIFANTGTAVLGPDLKVSNNVHGIHLLGVKTGKITGFEVRGNSVMGIGLDAALGVVVQGGIVASTAMSAVPTDKGGSKEVGDGINWLHGSDVSIESTVKIETSGRRPVIVDASSKGSFSGSLGGGDEKLGVVVQGGTEPSVPASLKISTDTKVDVLTGADVLPLALSPKAANPM